jgi:hypothetical protein
MYGGAPFGSVQYGGVRATGETLPAPSGGGSMMLMGIRSILLVLALPFFN